MIWLTWRQSRAQITTLTAVVAGFVVVMAIAGTGTLTGDPGTFLLRLESDNLNPALYILGTFACLCIPLLIGAFWGAPLIARELETGTFRLAWNQGISRMRWLAFKFGGLALTAAILTGVLSLMLSWWAGSIDDAVAHGGGSGVFAAPGISPIMFSVRGVVPAAYAVAAVAIGALIGLLTKRTVAALALTLLVVAAVQAAMPLLVRQHLMTPVTTTVPITDQNLRGLMIAGDPQQGSIGQVMDVHVNTNRPADWEIANDTVLNGKVQNTLPTWVANCANDPVQAKSPDTGAKTKACFARLTAEGYQQRIETQPGTRFWALQARETALLLIIAALASGACFLRLRRLR